MDNEPNVQLDSEALRSLPVFPLPRIVFFPGTRLPLHLFEPRYREMMEDMVEHGPMAMAVARLRDGWEDQYEGAPSIYPLAGAGRVLDWQRRDDGRFDLILEGVCRVKLEELPTEGKTYRRARAEVCPDRDHDRSGISHLLPTVLSMASTLAALVRQRHPEFDLGIEKDTAPGVIADILADRMVGDIERRQRLLEQRDVKVRLALLQESLSELMAQVPSQGSS